MIAPLMRGRQVYSADKGGGATASCCLLPFSGHLLMAGSILMSQQLPDSRTRNEVAAQGGVKYRRAPRWRTSRSSGGAFSRQHALVIRLCFGEMGGPSQAMYDFWNTHMRHDWRASGTDRASSQLISGRSVRRRFAAGLFSELAPPGEVSSAGRFLTRTRSSS